MEKRSNRTRLVVIFGGRSSEHEISCLSAQTVLRALGVNRYVVHMVYIGRDGNWYFMDNLLKNKVTEKECSRLSKHAPTCAIIPTDSKPRLTVFKDKKTVQESYLLDVAIPVLHGKNGEDGTIQGLFELARLPYVGCGVLASAASMDKMTTKKIVSTLGIRQAKCVNVLGYELDRDFNGVIRRIETELSYPVYVKPSRAGSSIGVTKAADRKALEEALLLACENDPRILVEETIVGREIECAVLGNADPKASGVGEILAADDFYTFEAKYHNAESKTVVDPDLPTSTVEEIRADACRIFQALDCKGLSRVDFFVENETGEVVFNEINTFPGFTSISMYPMLWKQAGIMLPDLVHKLIDLALAEANHPGRTA